MQGESGVLQGNIGTLVRAAAGAADRAEVHGALRDVRLGTAEAVKQPQRALGLEGRRGDGTLQTQLFSFDAPARKCRGAGNPAGRLRALQEGDNPDAVRALQTNRQLGYANGTPNGKYEKNTISAVKLFQRTANLEETGVATAALQALLFADDAPRYQNASANEGATAADNADRYYPYDIEIVELTEGSEGELVTYLQTRLAELGFFEGDVDGNYGSRTESAVKKFQKALGIKQTGDASVTLQQHLYSDAAPKSSVSFFKEAQKFETLAPGDSSKSVEKLQRQLWELGYL